VIEVSNVTTTERLHHIGDSSTLRRSHQQVNVIGHKHPSVDRYGAPARVLFQPMCVGRKVFLTAKASLPVITPLDNVLWDTW